MDKHERERKINIRYKKRKNVEGFRVEEHEREREINKRKDVKGVVS